MRQMILFTALSISVALASAADTTSLLSKTTSPTNRPSIQLTFRQDTARAAALRAWKISLAPLVGSQAFDAASSYGMRELNPLLASANGGFEMKATSLKLGLTGVLVGTEYLIVRRYPRSARVISKLNWTTGIVTTGFAVHNYAIK